MTEKGAFIITQEQFDEIVLPILDKHNKVSMKPVGINDGMLIIEPLPKHYKEIKEALKGDQNEQG